MAIVIDGKTIGSKKEFELGLGKVSEQHWKKVDDNESKRREAERKYHTKFLTEIRDGSDIDYVPVPQKDVSESYKAQREFKSIGQKLRTGEYEVQDEKNYGTDKEEYQELTYSQKIASIGIVAKKGG